MLAQPRFSIVGALPLLPGGCLSLQTRCLQTFAQRTAAAQLSCGRVRGSKGIGKGSLCLIGTRLLRSRCLLGLLRGSLHTLQPRTGAGGLGFGSLNAAASLRSCLFGLSRPGFVGSHGCTDAFQLGLRAFVLGTGDSCFRFDSCYLLPYRN